MYLPDDDIRELISKDVLSDAAEDNVQLVSYDLRTKEFHEGDHRCNSIDLKPGNSIFVSTIEVINLPTYLVAQVSLRNSWIRKGLLLDSPVYFPGHKTHIYFRLTNLAGETVRLKKEEGIAQVYFLKIDGNVSKGYEGNFSDENNASIVGDMDMYGADDKRMKKAVKPIKDLEQHIYVNVLALLAIFVGISTVSQTVIKTESVGQMIDVCMIQCVAFSILFLLVALLMPNKKRKWVYLIPLVIAGVCGFLLLKHEAWRLGPLVTYNIAPK